MSHRRSRQSSKRSEEPQQLKWGPIEWERSRFTVPSPKTKPYNGHAERVVPIFPELLPLPEDRFAEDQEGDKYVLPMLIGRTDTSLRNTVKRAIAAAEVEPWPRLWHNFRTVRQTELEDEFPSHVVCKWLGNSKTTAKKHYLRTLDHHFPKSAQKAAHDPTIYDDMSEHQELEQMFVTSFVITSCCCMALGVKVVREGLETVQLSPEETGILEKVLCYMLHQGESLDSTACNGLLQ